MPHPLLILRGLLLMCVLLAALAVGPSAWADPPPGEYTYDQALALGLVDPSEFTRFGGEPDCPAVPDPYPSAPDTVPYDGPTCYMPPEAQGLIYLVDTASAPVFGLQSPSATNIQLGSLANGFWQGGQALMEVSNPSVCHPITSCGAQPAQHFYSRIEAVTPGLRLIEVGWVETNHPSSGFQYCADVNDQFVMTVTWQITQGSQRPICHTAFNINPGGQIAVRERQYGSAGQNAVVMEIWDSVNQVWRQLRGWTAMRCWNADQSNNCDFRFAHEMLDEDQINFFPLNGGPDGLRYRNISLRTAPNTWPLFGPPSFSGTWSDGQPYELCRVFDWYHFRSYYAEPLPPCF